jgi:uncharacterized protein YoxC
MTIDELAAMVRDMHDDVRDVQARLDQVNTALADLGRRIGNMEQAMVAIVPRLRMTQP